MIMNNYEVLSHFVAAAKLLTKKAFDSELDSPEVKIEPMNSFIQKAVQKLKIPPVPPQVKAFVNKTINETKQKINRVKQDLAELEETIDKRVD